MTSLEFSKAHVQERADALRETMEPYRKFPVLVELATQGLDLKTAQRLAREYLPANSASPRIIAAAISNVHDEEFRTALCENLWEEVGCGKLEDSHIQMWARFVRAVGVDPEGLHVLHDDSVARPLVESYLDICKAGPEHRVLAILFSYEYLFCVVNTHFAEAVKKSGIINSQGAEFFSVHSVADIEHSERLAEVLVGSCKTEEDWNDALEVAKQGAQMVHDLFNDLATPVK